MDRESRLIERVRAHDVHAFESLYEEYHRLVFGLGLRILGDPAQAEDLTQAVFLKLWSAPDAFRGGSFAAWIARVARNRAIDMLRARAAQPQVEFPSTDLPLDLNLADEVVQRVDAGVVRSALAQLPHEQRELIVLGFFGGMTHRQLAAQTGSPLGTVKTRIRAGLQALRKTLRDEVQR